MNSAVEIAIAVFALSNSARVVAYLPQIVQVAREFAANAETTQGRSMVILGAGLNHWYHMDMNYRGIINMLVMCGMSNIKSCTTTICIESLSDSRIVVVGQHPAKVGLIQKLCEFDVVIRVKGMEVETVPLN